MIKSSHLTSILELSPFWRANSSASRFFISNFNCFNWVRPFDQVWSFWSLLINMTTFGIFGHFDLLVISILLYNFWPLWSFLRHFDLIYYCSRAWIFSNLFCLSFLKYNSVKVQNHVCCALFQRKIWKLVQSCRFSLTLLNAEGCGYKLTEYSSLLSR